MTVEDAAACGGSAAVQIYPPDGGLPDWAVPAPGTTYGQSVWLSGEVCNTGDCDETYDLAFEYDPAVVAMILALQTVSVPASSCVSFDARVSLTANPPLGEHLVFVGATSHSPAQCPGNEASQSYEAAGTIAVVNVDLDVDSNNDGTIDPAKNGTDDPVELTLPGE